MTTVITDTLRSRDSRKAARLAVNVDLDPMGTHIRVKKKSFPIEYAPGDVHEYNRRFMETLDGIRKAVGGDLILSDAHYDYFMKELRDVGVEARAILPPAMLEYIDELEADEPSRGISLDLTFPAGMDFLWEMIYSGDPQGAVEADKFWGFRYPLGHLFWESDLRSTIRLQKGVFASAHEELRYSKEELAHLDHILGELQEQLGRSVVVRRVDDAISQDSVCSDKLFEYFNDAEFEYGVVHFACHCINPEEGASKAYLLLTANRIKLELVLGRFLALAKRGFRYRPLVFLNACESRDARLFLKSLNFPSSLIKFGAGGVIATACTMPDYFASTFATTFYQSLLETPLDTPAFIGETLLKTSRHFLDTYKNPLGLAYGLYSISDQRLSFA